jgi:hypothetical protein
VEKGEWKKVRVDFAFGPFSWWTDIYFTSYDHIGKQQTKIDNVRFIPEVVHEGEKGMEGIWLKKQWL